MATYLPISILLPLLIHGRVPSSFSIVRSSICVVWQTSLPILQSCRLIWLEICSTMSPYKLDGNNLRSCWCNLVLRPSYMNKVLRRLFIPLNFLKFEIVDPLGTSSHMMLSMNEVEISMKFLKLYQLNNFLTRAYYV